MSRSQMASHEAERCVEDLEPNTDPALVAAHAAKTSLVQAHVDLIIDDRSISMMSDIITTNRTSYLD